RAALLHLGGESLVHADDVGDLVCRERGVALLVAVDREQVLHRNLLFVADRGTTNRTSADRQLCPGPFARSPCVAFQPHRRRKDGWTTQHTLPFRRRLTRRGRSSSRRWGCSWSRWTRSSSRRRCPCSAQTSARASPTWSGRSTPTTWPSPAFSSPARPSATVSAAGGCLPSAWASSPPPLPLLRSP